MESTGELPKIYGMEADAPYACTEWSAMRRIISDGVDEWAPGSCVPGDWHTPHETIYVTERLWWMDDLSRFAATL